jgi:hypothetical protein
VVTHRPVKPGDDSVWRADLEIVGRNRFIALLQSHMRNALVVPRAAWARARGRFGGAYEGMRIKYSFTKQAESGQNLPTDNIHGEKVRLSDV